ncbi:steroid receptor RNA activator 1, partial [Clarias magur]
MSDFYIKPGNQDRGWNDPPQFSYGLQTNAGGQKRNLLNKRVPPPQLSAQNPESGLSSSPAVSSIPPSNSVPPPVAGFTPPPKSKIPSGGAADSHQGSPKVQSDSTAQQENEPNFTNVQAPLFWALTACRQTIKKQVCDDVERRLKVFEEMWRSGKLSLPVKCRMNGLSQ